MTSSRILLAACLTLLLAACGDGHEAKAPTPLPPAQSAGQPAPVAAPAPKPAAVPPRQSEAAPAAAEPVASAKAPAVEAAPRPEAKAHARAEPRHQARTEPKARTVKKPAVDPAVKRPLPPVQLDLRLPRDLVHQLQPDKPVPEPEDKPLLPPLFSEKEKADQSPFAVGGRLIQRERNERETNDDSWHSDIRGAELQFQFRN